MRRHAQEFDDDVLMRHVELYVNEWTDDLGVTGAGALRELSARAAAAGVGTGAALQVFSG
jgi:1,4-dihydroxy-6-naphthoate synthase